jgi:serine/threonine-protein kinase RsbW
VFGTHATAPWRPYTPGSKLEIALRPRGASAARMRQALHIYLAQQCVGATVASQVVLAADEAFVNALAYAGGGDPIRVIVCARDGEVSVEVRDHGDGFSLDSTHPGTVPDVRGLHGRGLFLIQSMMDEVAIESGASGTTVRMVKRLRRECLRAS